MILEGIVTTLDPDGVPNVAPMGPRVEPDMVRFELRPFRTSHTYQNLRGSGQGVLHVTDDVLLIARAAIGLPVAPMTRPADVVQGVVLIESCRAYEFRVLACNDREERTSFLAETCRVHRFRDFFGLNRAKHAVIEAAILATRLELIPLETILDQYRSLAVLVEKTGGPDELAAFALLRDHLQRTLGSRGQQTDLGPE